VKAQCPSVRECQGSEVGVGGWEYEQEKGDRIRGFWGGTRKEDIIEM
jgi:rubredoxin